MSRQRIGYRSNAGWAMASLFMLFASGCATTATTTVHQHPDLESALARVETIAILPLEVGQLRATALGEYELQPERERTISQQLTRVLKAALQAKSYSVVTEPEAWPGDEVKPESPETQQLRSAYFSVSKQFPDEAASLAEARQLRLSVGPVAKTVAVQRQADALMIVRYAGYEKSGGRKTAEVVSSALIAGLTGIAGGPITGSEGQIRLTLIDGKSGDVLWTNRLSGRTDRKRGAAASTGYYGPADMTAKAVAQLPARALNE